SERIARLLETALAAVRKTRLSLPLRTTCKPKPLDGHVFSPPDRETRGHPFAGFHRMDNGGLAGFELAAPNHLVEMKQNGRAAAVAGVGAPKPSLLPRDAEAGYERIELTVVKLDRGNGENIVVDSVRVDAKLLGEFAQSVQ